MGMNRRVAISGSLALAAGASALPFSRQAALAGAATPVATEASAACDPYARLPQVPTFTVTSDDVAAGEHFATPQMSGVFGAGGEDRSPQLSWSGFPEETQSFVVTVFDPDAPIPSGFWHWAVADIPASVTELPAGAGEAGDSMLPEGAFQLKNDAGLAQYVGAAPPPGDPAHRYFIVVNALDVESLGVDPGATPAVLYFSMLGHVLARAVLVAIAEPAG
jgi:Raf kinase inhibitor-like YbhB/YbcL family protein